MKEKSFARFLSLIAKQGPYVTDMSLSLSAVIERTKEGSLNSGRFVVESAKDSEILDYPKGSPKLLELGYLVLQEE